MNTGHKEGRKGMGGQTREEDYIEHLFVASTHHTMLIFTEKGRCYWLNIWEIPEGREDWQRKGDTEPDTVATRW